MSNLDLCPLCGAEHQEIKPKEPKHFTCPFCMSDRVMPVVCEHSFGKRGYIFCPDCNCKGPEVRADHPRWPDNAWGSWDAREESEE